MRPDLNRLERWEDRLKGVFDEIDAALEADVSLRRHPPYPLHPARLPAGATSNPEDDGLFDVGAQFTVGVGSQHGPGYVLSVRLATLEDVPPGEQERIEGEVVRLLRQKLPDAFPGKKLDVVRDGGLWKIVGDLTLDDA